MENYITHKDVLVHKKKKRFPFTLFVLPVFLVLLVELLILSNNRSFIPMSTQNPYSLGVKPYLSPLASPAVGQVQIGVGGGPPPPSITPTPTPQIY